MYNKIIIIGNLTRDIDLRYLPSGSAIATAGIASSHKYKKQDGTQADDTCFVDVKLFGRAAEIAKQYLHKGSKVLIEGRLVYEQWTDQNGNKKSKHCVVAESLKMLDSKNTAGYTEAHQIQTEQKTNQASSMNIQKQESNIPEINVDEEEIPF